MVPHDRTAIKSTSIDEFGRRLRAAANVQHLMIGRLQANGKAVTEIYCLSSGSETPGEAEKLVRQINARLASLVAMNDTVSTSWDLSLGALRALHLPEWFWGKDYLLGVGQPIAGSFPVIACGDLRASPDMGLKDLMALGLAYCSQQMAGNSHSAQAWPDGLAEATLRMLSIGFFVVDGNARIVHDHGTGAAAAGAQWITARGRLSLPNDPERAKLREAIADAVAGKRTASLVSVPSTFGRMEMAAVVPLQLGDRALAIILFELPGTDHSALREHFCRTHSLTRSEGLIARQVLDGKSPNEIAAQAGMSIATVRSYLKQVLAKTGTHRQSELVSLYFSSILPISASFVRASPAAARSAREVDMSSVGTRPRLSARPSSPDVGAPEGGFA